MKYKGIWDIVIRYILLLILPFNNLYLFYLIFTPLTIYLSYFALNAIYGASLINSTSILVYQYSVNLIPACIAGAAYYLLLILNLATPMPVRKRINSLLYLFASFLLLNIVRIVLFISLMIKGYQYFDFTHLMTWYFGSTILLILIWFTNVWIFKIREIPVYTDMKNLYDLSRRKRR